MTRVLALSTSENDLVQLFLIPITLSTLSYYLLFFMFCVITIMDVNKVSISSSMLLFIGIILLCLKLISQFRSPANIEGRYTEFD